VRRLWVSWFAGSRAAGVGLSGGRICRGRNFLRRRSFWLGVPSRKLRRCRENLLVPRGKLLPRTEKLDAPTVKLDAPRKLLRAPGFFLGAPGAKLDAPTK
jgi:hypothetical protein